MKKIYFFLSLNISFIAYDMNAQVCNNLILQDDFSSSSGWQSQGNGKVSVKNGECAFDNVYNGTYNRVYRNLGATLSNNYWKAECDLSILSTKSGNGAGAIIMALTAGPLDFMSYDASQSYTETNQDGIAIVLTSTSSTDNNINNWFFLIESKKGNVRSYNTSSIIYADASISDYYLRLERTTKGMTQLSVFSDSTFTSHLPGSPVTFAIDSTITGLSTIQHGTGTSGHPSRLMDGIIDNDVVCDYIDNSCSNIILQDDFSSSSGWQSQGNGKVSVKNGECAFDNVYNGSYNRIYKNLGKNLSDSYWKAECDLSLLSANPSGNGAGAIIMALTAGTLDFMSYDASQSYTETNQDGIAIALTSNGATDNNINNWFFLIESKKGNVRSYNTSAIIYADATISDYYLQLERIAKGMAQLSVFSDSTFTTQLPGSPVTFVIDSTITGLSTIQHGTGTSGHPSRLLDGIIDNDVVCDNNEISDNIANWDLESHNQILIYPNPSSSTIYVKNEEITNSGNSHFYSIYNLLGAQLVSGEFNSNKQIDISQLPEAMYLLKISDSKNTYWAKFQKGMY